MELILQECLYPHIQRQYERVCSKLVQILKTDYKLMECLAAIKVSYHKNLLIIKYIVKPASRKDFAPLGEYSFLEERTPFEELHLLQKPIGVHNVFFFSFFFFFFFFL